MPKCCDSKKLSLTFCHFSDLSHSYRFVTSPGCWLRLSTHVTTMSTHESKSSTQVVMETTSNLWALTFDPWQVERLSLEQFGQRVMGHHHVFATVGKNIMVLRRVSFGWDWWVYLWGLGNMCQNECHGSLSLKSKQTEGWFSIANNQAPVLKFQKMQKWTGKNKALIIRTSHQK